MNLADVKLALSADVPNQKPSRCCGPPESMIAQSHENSSPPDDVPDEVRHLIAALSEEDRLLIICNYELYGGRWDLLKQDMLDRLEGRPYVFKLGERIKEDLERVNMLQELEKTHKIKLCDFVEL